MTNGIETIIANINEATLNSVFQNWTQGVYTDNLAALASALGVSAEEAEIVGQNWYDNN